MSQQVGQRPILTGIGVGPFIIVLFLLVTSLYALFGGMGATALVTSLCVSAVSAALVYVVWRAAAMRNPLFMMGEGVGSTVVLFVVAFLSFFFLAPYLHDNFGLQVVPLEVVGGQVVGGSIGLAWFLIIVLVTCVGVAYMTRKRRRRKL